MTEPQQPSQRYHALDGLRGLAAFIVTVHHVMLMSPTFFKAYATPGWTGAPTDYITYTPLHFFWGGAEAVYVFFVLSGFVLVLPFTEGPVRYKLVRYFPHRLVRLYLPVWGSIIFASSIIVVASQFDNWTPAQFGNEPFPFDLHVIDVLTQWVMVLGTNMINPPLWTLRIEIVFSILLPAYIVFARAARRFWLPKVMIILAVIAIGAAMKSSLQYLPIFAIGGIMAVERAALLSALSQISRKLWWFLVPVAVVLLNIAWLHPATASRSAEVTALTHPLGALGAAAIMAIFLPGGPAVRFGESRVLAWLGKRSFSLYLVHYPLILLVAFLLGGSPNTWLLGALAIPLSLLIADVFFKVVERPSHRLAKSAGTLATRRLRASTSIPTTA